MPKHTLEGATMRPDGPVSAEQLAELAYTLCRQLAPEYGLSADMFLWEWLSPEQQHCAIAVARRLLRRVDARVRYILHGGYTAPFVGEVEAGECDE